MGWWHIWTAVSVDIHVCNNNYNILDGRSELIWSGSSGKSRARSRERERHTRHNKTSIKKKSRKVKKKKKKKKVG